MKRKKTNKLNLSLSPVDALTNTQAKVLDCDKHMVLHGCAGTGKTFLSSYLAYYDLLRNKYDRILYIRSAVSTRDIGFLPGSEKEKMSVYKLPYIDIASKLFGRDDAYGVLETHGMVKFEPTSFVRGRSLENSFIIVDECQNMSFHELDSLITRVGEDSRIVFCGDYAQSDLPNNGIREFFSVLSKMKEFNSFEFFLEDVVRSSFVKSYLYAKSSSRG